MKRIICTVQKGMFSHAEIRKLEAGLKGIYQKHYRSENVNILWMLMPKGFAYAERKPSQASIILVEVDDNIPKEKREELMHLFSQYLLKNFTISPLDLVLSVANSTYVQQFFEAQQNRIHPKHRLWIRMKLLFTAIYSKIVHGYARLRVTI